MQYFLLACSLNMYLENTAYLKITIIREYFIGGRRTYLEVLSAPMVLIFFENKKCLI